MSVLQLLQAFSPFHDEELKTVISTAPLRYKVYQLPKRNGKGMRTIAHPAPEVKLLQRLLIDRVLYRIPVHACAVAYQKRKSIVAHVEPHLSSKYLMKLDFKDFFPSISSNDVLLHLQRHYPAFSMEDIRVIRRLTTWKNKKSGYHALSIGAPSSPLLSNSILFDFDSHISGACTALGVTYTRYADDLAFSTNHPNVLNRIKGIVERVLRELAYPRLILNDDKTVNVSRKYRRTLVGLVLTPDGLVSLGRAAKREMHAGIYNAVQGKLTVDELSTLRGRLAYAWAVEPTFIVTVVRKYGLGAMQLLELPFGSEQVGKKAA